MTTDTPDAPSPALDRPVDRRTIEALFARGLLSAAARDHALSLIEPPREWGRWVARILTVFGIALILAGIVYFFAYDWDRIPPLVRLGGAGLLLAAAIAGAGVIGLEPLAGRILVTVATVLVGVFLAVFGQVYQTGADAWGLFLAWSLLTLAWALLTNFAATWAVWLVVADLAIWLWWDQTRTLAPSSTAGATLSILVFDGLFLVLREILAGRGHAWAAARWTRFFLAVPTLAVATLAGIAYIGHDFDGRPIERASAAAAAVVFATAIAVYRRRLPDLTTLSAAVMGVCVVLVVLVQQLADRTFHTTDTGAFFLTGLVTLGLFALAVGWLRRQARTMEADHG